MRVVNSVTPGLGGPQVIRRRDGSQGPAHAFRGTTASESLLSRDARKGIPETKSSRKPFEPREAKCDQYFSSTLWGGDREPDRNDPLIRGEPEGDRLICEGFDPGSE